MLSHDSSHIADVGLNLEGGSQVSFSPKWLVPNRLLFYRTQKSRTNVNRLIGNIFVIRIINLNIQL